jgi:hypothetical protein
VLVEAVRRDGLRTEVAAMRERMRNELSKGTREAFDIKQDAGGIADIEFLVQYLVLQHAASRPELLRWPDNMRQIEDLRDAGLLPVGDSELLHEAYVDFRQRLHRLALANSRPGSCRWPRSHPCANACARSGGASWRPERRYNGGTGGGAIMAESPQHRGKRAAALRGEPRGPAAVVSHAGDETLEFAPQGLPAHRGDRPCPVSILRRGLHAGGRPGRRAEAGATVSASIARGPGWAILYDPALVSSPEPELFDPGALGGTRGGPRRAGPRQPPVRRRRAAAMGSAPLPARRHGWPAAGRPLLLVRRSAYALLSRVAHAGPVA